MHSGKRRHTVCVCFQFENRRFFPLAMMLVT